MDKKEIELRKVYHRVKGLITQTERKSLGVRINESEQIDSVTIYGDVLVIHIDYNTENKKFTLTGYNDYNEELNNTVKSISDVSDYVEYVLFDI